MTERIEGLSIGLDIDQLALDRGLTGLKDKLKTVNSEMKANLSAFDRADQSIAKHETRLNGLNKKFEIQKRIVQQSRAEYEKMVAEHGEGSKQAEAAARSYNNQVAALNSLERNIQRTTNELQELRREQRQNESGWTKLNQRMDETSTRLTNIGDRMRTVGQTMAVGVTAPLAGVGVAAVRTGMEFDKQMSKVQAISGATGKELAKMREQAVSLGASTTKSSSEVASGMTEMAASGYEVNEIMAAMPGVIAASEAAGADMAQTAEVMSSALNIFGLEASKASEVADILAQTANVSAADITDMQYALKYAGPPAAALGISLEELSGAIGIMTNAGMKGEQAGTTLRAALLGLLDPSEENSKLMTKMGVQITDAQGNFVGLSNLVKNLSDSMAGQTETQKAATLASLVGTEAVSGMLSLMKAGPAEIDKMTQSLENSGGASAKAAEIMTDNFAGAMEELQGTLESIGISVSDELTPVIKDLTVWLTDMGEKFQSLSPEGKRAIIMFGLIAAGIAPVTIALGALITSVGAISGGIGTAVGWFGKLKNGANDSEESVRGLSEAESQAAQTIQQTNDALNDGARAARAYNEAVDPTRGNIDDLGQSESDAAERIESTTQALNDGERALRNYDESSSSTSQSVDDMGRTARNAADNIDNANQATTRAGRGMGVLRRGAAVSGAAVGALGENFGTVADLTGRMVPQLGNAEEGILGIATTIAESTNGFADFRQNADDAANSTDNLNRRTGDASNNVRNLNRTTQATTRTVSGLGNTARTAAGAAGTLAAGAGGTSGRLAGLGARALGVVKNFGPLTKILGVAKAGVGALGGPVGLIATTALPALVSGGVKLYKHLKEESIPTIDSFGSKVSESTTKAVLGYKKLNDDATAQLNQLLWSGQEITPQIAEQLTGTFGKMGDQISSSLKKDFETGYQSLNTFLGNSKALSEKEEQALLNNMTTKHQEQQKKLADHQARINEIWNTASQEKRGITKEEAAEIDRIQQQMMTTAVQTMSKSESEQKTILSRLKADSGNITAQQAAETVQNSIKAKNGAVKEANEKYNKVKAAIEFERDVTGSISESQANTLIADAERQRNESIKKAEEMHKGVVKQAKEQAAGQVDEIDWATGKVLTNWDKMVRGVAKAVNTVSDGINWVLDKINIDVEIPDWKPKGYAVGTPSTGHPGGPAIVGEKGRELAYIPGQGVTMLGTRGPELHPNLPKGTSVLPNKHTENLLKSYGFPGYENGIGDFFSWALDGPKNLMSNIWEKFKPTVPNVGGMFKTMGTGIVDFLKKHALGYVETKLKDFFSVSDSGGSGVQRWAGVATKALMMTGQYTKANLDRLLYQMDTESDGNPRAINLWDSNAKRGTPSKGLMQVIDPTFRAYAYPGFDKNIYDPLSNILASIRYAVSRYGSLAKAYRGVGYASGGLINTEGLYQLAEGGWPEWVIPTDPSKRTDAMKLLALAGREITGNKRPQQLPNVPGGSNDNSILRDLLNATLQQNQILMRLLQKDTSLSLDGREIARSIKDPIKEFLDFDKERKNMVEGRAY